MKRTFFCLNQRCLSVSRRKYSLDKCQTPAPNSTRSMSFENIPEAKGLPLLGTLLDYTPMRGFKIAYIYELWNKRHEEYGDIFKEKFPMTKDYFVCCRSPEDTAVMFRSESRAPIRPKVDGLSFLKKASGFNESFPNLSGEDWHRHRQVVNPLLNSKMVWKYVKEQQDVSKDFAELILKNLDEKKEIDIFDSFLDRWALEMSGTFLLHTRLGLVNDSPSAKIQQLFRGTYSVIEFIGNSFVGLNLWKYNIQTKETKEVVAHATQMHNIMHDLIEEKKRKEGLDNTVLSHLLNEGDLSEKERLSLVYDAILASVETTSKSAALILYCLTHNSETQEKLRNEVLALPSDRELTGRMIDRMTYMNAFIKEAVRLYPLVHVFNRIYEKEIVLSGYRIPPGTSIINTSNSSQNRNPNYFTDPDKFMPERWMEGRDNVKKFGLTGPFGLGARACPGRRFAMQEIRILLIELLKHFRIEYHYKPIVSIMRGTGFPSEEPKFRFIPLEVSSKL